ncbi:hypothetical protein DC498_08475 [Terrimonas sp.]|uniref:hypothetical protein n=1 Tax=Terrimonas sp. TaxID=1914338 RepID=UPI000D512ABA|nr:hypothetical protein [Terrimonas sp.]PVD52548.1 hypothetical protein DC498_08475 [Terrimonas sp.]
MDTKLIQQYGEDILCYRLRTARQKKRMRFEDFDKQLIQLDIKRRALWVKRNNLGCEPLIPPIQKGWKRFFVLREDVAGSKHAEFFQCILDKINTKDWSAKRDFKVRRRKLGRKIYVVKPQKLLAPDEHHFRRLGFTEAERQLFYPELRYEKWCNHPVKRYVFAEPWRFVLRVQPNMIDKVRIKDAELESEIDKIDNYIERRDLEKRMGKILRGWHKYGWWDWKNMERYDEVNPYKNKSLKQMLDMIRQDERE